MKSTYDLPTEYIDILSVAGIVDIYGVVCVCVCVVCILKSNRFTITFLVLLIFHLNFFFFFFFFLDYFSFLLFLIFVVAYGGLFQARFNFEKEINNPIDKILPSSKIFDTRIFIFYAYM